MYTMFTISFYGALKSLFGEYKFKTLHIRKSLFSASFWYFLHKIASLSCISTKKHYFDLFSYSKNHFICLLSIVLKRSLYYCFFNHLANTHYFWFSTTVSSLLINSSPCISLIIHICVDPQTREAPSYCKSYCIITKISQLLLNSSDPKLLFTSFPMHSRSFHWKSHLQSLSQCSLS